jgi:CubicO group peptidase (beta-lactamase class C family)
MRRGTIERTDQSATTAVLGDGGIYSSADDLGRWIRALEARTILSDAEWTLATTRASLSDGSESPYGFGWFIDTFQGRTRLRHHGETTGFTNAIQYFPADRIAIAVLTNRSDSTPWRIVEQIAIAAFSEGK